MKVQELIKIYNENYSFYLEIKKTSKKNKLILLPFFLIIISVIAFYSVYVLGGNQYKILVMTGAIIIYLISILSGAYLQARFIKTTYGSNEKFEEHKLNEIKKFIKQKFNIASVKQYELLDNLIKKEIEVIEFNRKFPFSNTIRQLIVAVLVTGLLSYSIREFTNGDKQMGVSLLSLYLLIIGTLFILGTLIYSLKDFGKLYKLKNISRILSELLISISRNEEEIKTHQNKNNNNGKKKRGRRYN
ncbi:hypothetical protein AB9M62_25375 [Bacillales bacterium AN1005]